jgi:23S rRNA (guanosine2251-2'-O)-methyltransferase
METLYGLHPVAECLKAGRRGVRKLWVLSEERLQELQRVSSVTQLPKAEVVSKDLLVRKANSPNHQGVVAEVDPFPYVDWQDLLDPSPVPLVVVLDNLEDPQNVGAILRSALCAGATGVTLRKHHAAQITAAVAKASAGACEHLRVALVPNQPQVLRSAGEAGLNRAALDMEGQSLWEAPLNWRQGLLLVVGAEGAGVSRLVLSLCDVRLRIPMAGAFDSLNASVAASLALFEAARHRR